MKLFTWEQRRQESSEVVRKWEYDVSLSLREVDKEGRKRTSLLLSLLSNRPPF